MSIQVNSSVKIMDYDPSSNRRTAVDAVITGYKKVIGNSDMVHYNVRGKNKKLAVNVFKQRMV